MEVVDQIGIECEGVAPTEVADDANGEIGIEELRGDGVVVADGRDSAEQIADGPPPEADFTRN